MIHLPFHAIGISIIIQTGRSTSTSTATG